MMFEGSGTATDESQSAVGPPGIAAMVNVAPAPIVKVFWATEVAVKLQPADKIVVPTPLMLPTVCVPESNWRVAVAAEVDIAEAVAIWPVEASSSRPLPITVGPA